MDIKLFFGIFSGIFSIIFYIVYIKSIFKNETKPHIYTRFLYLIIILIIFLWQISNNGWYGSIFSWVWSIFCFITFVLSFKYWIKNVTISDKIFLILWLISVPIWYFSWTPIYSILLLTLVDFLASIPTIRKTYKNPYSENLQAYIIGLFSLVFSILALDIYNVVNLFYLVFLVILDSFICLIIIFRRRLYIHEKIMFF